MLRLVLLALILLGLGAGLSHGWIEIHWDRMLRDSPLPKLGSQFGFQESNPSKP